jgi:prophage tail gpP-like protein
MATELPPITVEPDNPGATDPGAGDGPASTVTPGQNTAAEQQPGTPAEARPWPTSGFKEIIVLEVNGWLFSEWTTVRVEQLNTEPFPKFQFECTEESPIPLKVDALQFVPGDIVRVFIGGQLVVYGYIIERHVGYDAKQHGVRLIGTGDTIDVTTTSVPPDKLGNHDGKTWQQLANDLTAHLGIKVTLQGDVDNTPIKQIQVNPGETIWNTLDRYAKHRNIILGSRPQGGILAIGDHSAETNGYLIEGQNILRANCVVRDQWVYKHKYGIGQDSGSDQSNMDKANKQIAYDPGPHQRNRYLVILGDIADIPHGIQQRLQMEKKFTDATEIEAQITVQGWFKDYSQSNDLWKAGEYYHVRSPSLILDQTLGCKGCVYEQSDAGSTTTLTMVDPRHMGGKPNFS